ncbi:flotillin family protein [Chondromyces apiculatus]|uniref:Inner membrane protein YqiK n=1 Tax=Chondromyces apiculatus DSM 436 TaxID=1192034 RepID=A0A017SXA5_9BACT|nr:flotillin family protein [Chondromyces apiculatus]EYF01558.1 Inner membrane protein YqiK [Chondromyces apiculatus DSM 436]
MWHPLLLSAAQAAQREATRRGRSGTGGSFEDALLLVVLAAGGVVVAFVVFLLILRSFLHICKPNEILVFSGRRHVLPDGTVSGYKILHGGRGFRLPFLEQVSRMDMRLFPVEVTVQNAYSKGGIPLSVHAIANVKIASNDAGVRNAVERFLNASPAQIAMAAQQTLEGVLREVVSQLTPEEVNEDRLKFAETLMENARDDFDKLGLELDVLKVQHVSDEQHYLENLGRGRIATMLRDAANAENAASQAVAEAQAAARQRAETATKRAEMVIAQRRNGVRAEFARFEADARQVENEADIAAQTARAVAEQELQAMRAELEKLRLHCDVVLPAEAQRRAGELRARGEAAPTVENGKAAAEALGLVALEWVAAGRAGKDVYVLQQLRSLVGAAALRVARTEIGEVSIVAGAEDDAFSAVVASYPAAVARVLHETGRALGIDMRALLGVVPASGEGRV